MKTAIQMELEMSLGKRWLHIYTKEAYQEDYQIPMLQKNKIERILPVEGCEVEGKGRYTYNVSGMTSLKSLYEKKRIKKSDIEEIVQDLMKTAEVLRQFMLNPDCLILQPDYIFQKDGRHCFCYLPGYEGEMETSFHELSEYFVKMLDYEDMEGICLAYELHKATLQGHYDLEEIIKEYKKHERKRKKEQKEKAQRKEDYGNLFSLTEEEECEEKEESKEKGKEKGWLPVWKNVARHVPGRRWGQWQDLITETDGQEKKTPL